MDEVGAVFAKSVVGALGVVGVHRAALDLGELAVEGVAGHSVVGEQAAHGGAAVVEDAEHQVLNGDVAVAHLLGDLLGEAQYLAQLRRGIDLAAAAADAGQLAYLGVQLREQRVAVDAHPAEQRADEAAVLVDEGVEQVLARQVLVAVLLGHGLGGIYGFNRFLGVFFSVHGDNTSFRMGKCQI